MLTPMGGSGSLVILVWNMIIVRNFGLYSDNNEIISMLVMLDNRAFNG